LNTPVEDVKALEAEYDAVFVASGLWSPGPGLPGMSLTGVTHASDFLIRCRRDRFRNPVGPEVVVVGGGNVAVDAAMAAVCCGLEQKGNTRRTHQAGAPRVHILYRRTRREMPAWEREIVQAERHGVLLHYQIIPLAFEGRGGRLAGIRVCRARLGRRAKDGRPLPVPISGSEFVFPCDQAILATGLEPDPAKLTRLPRTERGLYKVDAATLRIRGHVFAGGDAVRGADSIVAAVRDGKTAARSIARQLGLADQSES
jgi:formate dehydrogenase beta subunit